jgi:outer membrane lipoprotein-sorting protein
MMKKLFIYTLFIISAVTSAYAQKDVQAKTILNQVSQKYRSFDAIKSDFLFTINSPKAININLPYLIRPVQKTV